MKKLLSVLLAVVMLCASAALFSGCSGEGSGEFPVTIGNVTIKSEPKAITVLSDCLADVISYIGYDVKMVGRSIECDQEYLSVVPVVGSSDNPSIDTITGFETDLVIADNQLTEKSKKKLEDAGIPVIVMQRAENFDDLKTLYVNLGTALGGNTTGKEKGEEAYTDLIDTLDSFKKTVGTGVIKTSAYLYLDENNALCTFTKGSIEATLFGYSGAMNIFANQQDSPLVSHDELKMGTPTYIFYDNDEVLTYLMNDEQLSTLSALTENRTCLLPLKDFSRQGATYEEIVYTMIDTMFVDHDDATPDEATVETESETVAETQAETETKSSDEYDFEYDYNENVVTDLDGNPVVQ